MQFARPYEVEVQVAGVTVVRTQWAYSADDAVYQQVMMSKRENGVFQVISVRPPEERKDNKGGIKAWSIKRFLRR